MKGPDFSEIKDRLLREIKDLAKELVPDGVENGDYWIGRSPLRADRRAGSFWIRISGRTAIGAWKDEATGETSDIINLIKLVKRHDTMAETRKWCMRRLGMTAGPAEPPLSAEEQAARAAQRQAEIEQRAREDAAALAKRSSRAFGKWLKAQKLSPATFAGSLPDLYFRSRALDLARDLIARGRPLPGCLRFFPALDYQTDAGELIELPCIAALMTGPAGTGQALHQTWLKPDGTGKAELPDPENNKARKIWGPPNGAVMRLAKGAGELTPEEAARQGVKGPLVVTEGLEDGLSVMLALPAYRVWAAGTLGNIGNVPVLPCIDRIIVAADNDWGKPQAMSALERGIHRLKSQGVPVRVARAPRGKDMNDLLKGETI